MTEYPEATFDYPYFADELLRFRAIMTSTDYTVEQVDAAFRGLTTVYFQCTVKDKEERQKLERHFLATANEHQRRLDYRIIQGAFQ